MPRQERTKSGTGIYHVMLRGINKQDMFEDDEDYLQMTSIKTKMITEPSLGHPRVFRMTDADILGKHAGAPHVNFEIMAPNPDPLKLGKPKVIINRHIYIK